MPELMLLTNTFSAGQAALERVLADGGQDTV